MSTFWKHGLLFSAGVLTVPAGVGCDTVPAGAIVDVFDGGDGDGVPQDLVELAVYATDTGGASGIALHPDGGLYAVNGRGLFGPIEEGDDLSAMTPIGATNLADDDLFDLRAEGNEETKALVLAISNSGEFWIGTNLSQTLAVVPATGGEAVPFLGLFREGEATGIKPETMVIVPDGFEGPQMRPGNLLVSLENPFSLLAAIDVDSAEQAVIEVDNALHPEPNREGLNREGHHLTFGLDGTLYSSRGLLGQLISGIQTIDTDGTPTDLPGTWGMAAESFVGLQNGDLVIRGTRQTADFTTQNGILFYSADARDVTFGAALPPEDRSEHDEMIISPDGSTIFLSLPNRNEIVRVIDRR